MNADSVRGSVINQGLLTTIHSLSKPDFRDAWELDDEPTENDFHALGVVADWMRANTPDALIYNNISYRDINSSFLDKYLNTVKPDMLMTDTYPYYKPSKSSWYPENPDWFKIAMTVRNTALAHGIPYFTWLEAFQGKPGDSSTAGTLPFFFRLPSESEMRAEAFTALTMGYKGLAWFGFDQCGP